MNMLDAEQIILKYGGELIAGKIGLSRDINFFEVLETPNVKDWIKEGVLVLTTFYSNDQEVASQLKIVRELCEGQAAGVVIRLDRFLTTLHPSIKEYAQKNNFPLFVLPDNVLYKNILSDFYLVYFSENANSLNVDNVSCIDEYLDKLHNYTKSNVYIEDSNGHLLFCNALSHIDEWRDSFRYYSEPMYEQYKKELRNWYTMIDDEKHVYIFLPTRFKRIIIPISINNELVAWLHLSFFNETLLNTVKQIDLETIRRNIREKFLEELVETFPYFNHSQSVFEQIDFHYKQNVSFRIIKLIDSFGNDIAAKINPYSFLIKRIERVMNHIPHIHLSYLFFKEGALYMIIMYNQSIYKILSLLQNKFQKIITGETKLIVSERIKGEQSLEKYIESLNTLEKITKIISQEEKIYTFEKLGMYEFLLDLSKKPKVVEYVKNVLSPLDMNKNLEDTLRIFMENNGNILKSSEKLFIHRRTLTNRIKQIEKYLDVDIEQSETRFILQLCLKIKTISEMT